MDMKKILQAMDGVSTKPVEGASDMKKFVSIINEGANPHKVALPVQMAMQHYQKPKETKKVTRPALIDKYFEQVQDEQLQEQRKKRQLVNQYASTIAQRVLMKESALRDKDDLQAKRKALQDIQLDPETHKDPELKAELIRRKADLEKEAKHKKLSESQWNEGDQPDAVTMDVPLLIRIMEYAREDAQTDMDLHDVAEQLISLSQEGRTLTMDDYDEIVSVVSEGKKIKPKKKSDPCWTGYHQVGMKKKDGEIVPNCTTNNSHRK